MNEERRMMTFIAESPERAPDPFGESVAQIYGSGNKSRTDEHARN